MIWSSDNQISLSQQTLFAQLVQALGSGLTAQSP